MVRSSVVALAACFVMGVSVSAQDLVARGQKVYVDRKCAVCHSIAGKGNKKGPLDGVGTKLTADDIRLWMTDAKTMTGKAKATRKPFMKSYKLSKDDLGALVAYMVSLKK